MAEKETTGSAIKKAAEEYGFVLQHSHGNIYILRRNGKMWAWFQINSAGGLVAFAAPNLVCKHRSKGKLPKLLAEMQKAAQHEESDSAE